jgi:F420-non-reducing hydrogenase large subunit
MTKTVSIDPITRLEGHGRIDIFLDDDGKVENAYLRIPELRGFERFCVGRPVEELPRITTRICGVCPEAHHMASAKAADAVYHVEPPPTAVKLRRLLYNTFYVADHAVHFYILAGPDFVVGPDAPVAERNIFGLISKVGVEAGKHVIKSRARAQELVKMLGGRAIHQVTSLPGGVSRGMNEDEQGLAKEVTADLVEFGKFTLQILDDLVLSNPEYLELITGDVYRHETHYMGLVDENNHPDFYDGDVRVVDDKGVEIARFKPDEYLDHVAEHVEPWTYLKFPYLKAKGWKGFVDGNDSGVYRAAPLARLNVADGMSTPLAHEQYERMIETLGGKPVHYTLAYHWARVIELVNAAELAYELARDPEITSPEIRTVPTETPTEGVGVVEAPRGILFHHYVTDTEGIVEKANLIVGTTNNYAPINMSIKKAAKALVDRMGGLSDGVLNMIEMAFRAYDPCFGCATHFLPGQMPMEVTLYDAAGEVVDRIVRN